MTISTTTAKSRYAGDGATTSFPTGFKFLDNDHVKVILRDAAGVETAWTEGTEYSLSGAGAPGGGTVTVNTSPADYTPAAGETLVIKLAFPAKQETSLPLGGAFPSTAVEAMSDLAALRDQQIEEALSRAVKFKETTALAEMEFPDPEAGKPVGWNAAGDALMNLKAIGHWRGDWMAATDYVALDVARDPVTKDIYVCNVAHTSGGSSTDLSTEKWALAIDVSAAAEDAEAAVVDAVAAANAAVASEGNAATSAADAAAAQAAAEAAQIVADAAASQVENAKLEWQGDWSAGGYQVNDAVAHLGASWIATVTTTEEPGPGASDWDLLAAGGDAGDVGDVKTTIRTTPPAGWLLLNGDSIGSAASGADQASDDYEALFTLCWESMADAQAPVSGGRGASAAADWAANKTLTMPDARGRTIIGGGTGSNLTARTHGDTGGEEEHVLTEAEMPSHSHSIGPSNAFARTSGPSNIAGIGNDGSAQHRFAFNASIGTAGSDQAHNNMQPWLALSWIIRY